MRVCDLSDRSVQVHPLRAAITVCAEVGSVDSQRGPDGNALAEILNSLYTGRVHLETETVLGR